MPANGVYLTKEDVLLAVKNELEDEKYNGMFHHEIKTYNAGCKGPLCRKRMRDYGREMYRNKNSVPTDELHKPTVRTQWDSILDSQPRQLTVGVS